MNETERKNVLRKILIWEEQMQTYKFEHDWRKINMVKDWLFGMWQTLKIQGETELADKAKLIIWDFLK